MNNNPLIASRWNGRILLKILCKDIDRPERSIINMPQEEIDYTNKIGRNIMWSCDMKLYSMYYLPNKYNEYSLKVTCQDNSILFTKKRQINNV